MFGRGFDSRQLHQGQKSHFTHPGDTKTAIINLVAVFVFIGRLLITDVYLNKPA